MRGVTTTAFAAVFAACAVATPASSHDHATGVVKERMELMEAIGKRMKAINSRIRNKQQLDAIRDDARAIAANTTRMTGLFPPGSTQHPTEARASIWQNFTDFEKKAKALEQETLLLVETNTSDLAVLAARVRAVSQTCASCHEMYRVKR